LDTLRADVSKSLFALKVAKIRFETAWKLRAQFLSPQFTTAWDELLSA
jgi:hypothetical protein